MKKVCDALAFAGVLGVLFVPMYVMIHLYQYEMGRVTKSVTPSSVHPDIRHCMDGSDNRSLWDCIRNKEEV